MEEVPVTQEQVYAALKPVFELACQFGDGAVELRFSTDLHVHGVSVAEACAALEKLEGEIDGTSDHMHGVDE